MSSGLSLVSNSDVKSTGSSINSLELNGDDEAGGQKDRRSFFAIIIFLGCFSLIALYGAVYLNASIQNVFQGAISTGLTWESARQRLTNLSILAGDVNAPINDVFVSNAIDTQRERMRQEYLAFLKIFNELTVSLQAQTDETSDQILMYLEDVNNHVYDMMSEAEFVFTYLQADQLDFAVERMALANRMFRDANILLGRADEVVQRSSLERFQADAASVQELYGLGKAVIGVLTLCFIIFVFIGIRMVKTLNRNQAKLAFSRLLLSKTIHSVADAVIGCDKQGFITDWNRQAESLFGEELSGHCYITELVPGLSRYMTEELNELAHQELHIDHLKAVNWDKDEPDIDVDINIANIGLQIDEQQQHTAYVLTIRDMRDVRRNAAMIARSQAKLRLQLFQNDLIQRELAEQTEVLKEAKLKAEASTEAKSRFLAIMSHELRTPMNAVLGFSKILQRGNLNKAQTEAVHRIIDASDHLLGIINDILDMSKIEAGGLALENREVYFVKELNAVVQSLAEYRKKKSIRFLTYIDPLLPEKVLTDTTRLRQVLTNLIGNAFQFTEDGSVWLRIYPVENTASEIGLTPSGKKIQFIRFEVHDTGIGMSSQQQTKVFDPFTQADTSITRKYGGTGLGLTITRQLVASFGGAIELISKEGHGSCFAFTIPMELSQDNEVTPLINVSSKTQIAVLTQDVRFIDWVDYSLSFINGTFKVFNTIGHDLLNWWDQVHTAGNNPRIIIDGFLSEYSGIDLIDGTDDEKRFLSACIYLVNVSSESLLATEQAYGKILYMPVATRILHEQLLVFSTAQQLQDMKKILSTEQVPNLHNRQILVVDDVLSNRQYLHEVLKPTGCGITLVESAQQAIDVCDIRLFDLILMDIHMPGMNGYEASRAIKKIAHAKKTHIVGLTADSIDASLFECLESEMTTCLVKPCSPNELYATLLFLINKDSKDTKTVAHGGFDFPGIDQVQLDIQGALDRINHRTDLYQKLISAFLKRIDSLSERLDELFTSNASTEADQYLASMRGTAQSVGATELSDAISQFEAAMQNGEQRQFARDHCKSALARTISAMKIVEQRIHEETPACR